MTTFVGLLRGINVSGKKPIRMDSLKAACESLAWREVRTYLQSGNIVFRAPPATKGEQPARLKACIAQVFGHEIDVLVISAVDFTAIAQANPLPEQQGGDAKLHHCTFLSQPITAARFAALKLPLQGEEQVLLRENVVYLYCPDGYGKTKLNNGYFEKALGVAATTRNWRTVLVLRDMCAV